MSDDIEKARYGPEPIPPEVRFWKYVNKTDTCWLWTGAVKDNGYGNFWNGHMMVGAHRWIYEGIHGPTPQFVCHHCDVRNCVRPDHLFAGTQKQNMQDAKSKDRLSSVQLEMDGVTRTMTEWSALLDIKLATVWARLKNGWSVDRALKTPVRGHHGR